MDIYQGVFIGVCLVCIGYLGVLVWSDGDD